VQKASYPQKTSVELENSVELALVNDARGPG